MRFSFEWLNDLVKFKESSAEIADLLTMYFAETTATRFRKRSILEVDLLANRVADASGHFGLAREIAAIKGKKFSYPQEHLKESKEKAARYLKVEIKTSSCNSYLARIVKGVKVQPSPSWLQNRLIDCGLRPINNIVDATNYVMLETGQPLHVFDYDKVDRKLSRRKNIIVRQAKKGEKITTLENKTYSLDPSIMIIADSSNPLAIAGIKGGKEAEVDKNTTNLILESANFKGVDIRHATKKIGLTTDASLRFEHNLAPELSDYAIDRLSLLIHQLSGGIILQGKVGKFKKRRKITIPLRWEDWKRFLGEDISSRKVVFFLSNLGFTIQKRNKYILVSPPVFRNDIKVKEDVMGEVVRLQGVNNIPARLPKEILIVPPRNELWRFRQELKNWLREDNLNEVYTYSFLSEKDEKRLPTNWKKMLVEIANPTSALTRYLRPSLLINLLKAVSSNFRFCDEVRFFEDDKIYWQKNGHKKEKFVLAGMLAQKKKSFPTLFYQGKGILEDLFYRLGIDEDDYEWIDLDNHDYSALLSQGGVVKAGQETIAIFGIPKIDLLKQYDCLGEIVFWEIDVAALLKLVNEEREYQPLPKYPAVIRDISLLVSRSIPLAQILNVIQSATPFYLEDVDLFDIYEGNNLANQQKSVSFHLIFRASDHTLKKEEVDKLMDKIYRALGKIEAKIR